MINKESQYSNVHQYTGYLKSLAIILLGLMPLRLIWGLIKLPSWLLNKLPIEKKLKTVLESLFRIPATILVCIPICFLYCIVIPTIVNTMSYTEVYIADFFCGGFGRDEPGYKRIKDCIIRFFLVKIRM